MRYNAVVATVLPLVCCCCLVRVGADVNGWKQEDYPNVFREPFRCGRPYEVNETWICDPDGILTPSQGDEIDDTLKQIQNNSNCLCPDGCVDGTGFRIAVAVVGWMSIEISVTEVNRKRLKFQSEEIDIYDATCARKFTPKKQQAYEFAKYLLSDWFDDEGGCDNNVVVFYSYKHNQLAFALGDDVWPMVSALEYASLVDGGRRRLGGDQNTTYEAVDYIIRKLNRSIQNGPGLSLGVVYSITVVGALVVLVGFMCLVSNTCCRVEIPRKLNADKTSETSDTKCTKRP